MDEVSDDGLGSGSAGFEQVSGAAGPGHLALTEFSRLRVLLLDHSHLSQHASGAARAEQRTLPEALRVMHLH